MKEVLISSSNYLIMVVPIIAGSVFLMNMLQNGGLVEKLSWISRPLTRFGHMKEPVGLSFITSFGSPTAANGMLRGLFDKNIISKKELVIAVLANAFPIMVMESRTMLPVMISLIGETGLLMFSILLFLRFIQTMIVLVTGRFILKRQESDSVEYTEDQSFLRGTALLSKSLSDTMPTIKRVILISTPITILSFYLLKAGVFDRLSEFLKILTRFLPIPVEGLGIVAAYFGHYVAGYTIAGTMLSQGTLTVKEVILTLLAAKILGSVLFTIRHSTPYYVGIFGSRMGVQIMFASVTLRNVINLAALFILYFFW